MFSSILETRKREKDGKYLLSLEIPEKEFFLVYDNADRESAKDLLKKFLVYRQDDARLENIDINYDKNKHIVNVVSELNYLDNDYTSFF